MPAIKPQSAATVQDQWVYRAGKARLRFVAITCAILAWGITQLLHFLLYPVVDETMIVRRMPADMLGGVLVGLLLYRVMDQAYERRLAVLERLQIIARLKSPDSQCPARDFPLRIYNPKQAGHRYHRRIRGPHQPLTARSSSRGTRQGRLIRSLTVR